MMTAAFRAAGRGARKRSAQSRDYSCIPFGFVVFLYQKHVEDRQRIKEEKQIIEFNSQMQHNPG